MTKRKRGSTEELHDDPGLGATLSMLRGENNERDSAQRSKPVAEEDDGGWTQVESKKRRKGYSSRSENWAPTSRSPESSYRHSIPESGSTQKEDDVNKKHNALAENTTQFENPFAPTDDSTGERAFRPTNPFSTNRDGEDSKSAARKNSTDGSMDRRERRKERKLERNYPSIEHSENARLNSHVKITDLQSLALYLLADGNAPTWVSVRSRMSIRQVVMLMVPGLEQGMFNGDLSLRSSTGSEIANEDEAKPKRQYLSPDDFYPARLKPSRLPTALKPLSDIFDYVWPIQASGERRGNQYTRLHSPIHTMLTSQIPRTREEKKMRKNPSHKGPTPQNSNHWDNKRTPITEYIATLSDQQENEYVIHPAWFTTPESKEAAHERRKVAKQTANEGWVDTNVACLEDGNVPDDRIEQGSVTAGRHILAVDCEMCKAEDDQLVLTRISIIDWDGTEVLDKLVKPDVTIKDYLTQWSGITPAMLEGVTTTLVDIQKELLEIITPHTILLGHSLNSDLNALKLTHPFLIDSGILYPHPRGPPYKQSLKWLAQKFLHSEIQKGAKGHNSIEDAQACLYLVKQKCERGPQWGTGDTNAESIFKRLGRTPRPKTSGESRAGAVVDWGDPTRGHGGQAEVAIGCESDSGVVEGIELAVKGQAVGKEGATEKVDFIWGRLRELELARGWWDDTKTADVEAIRQKALRRLGLANKEDEGEDDVEVTGSELGDAVSRTVEHIVQVYDSLPRCTAFIVYSGTGDPREVRRLQQMQQQYRREYATKKWDNLSVKWTDTEIQALSQACQSAREGVGFIAVK